MVAIIRRYHCKPGSVAEVGQKVNAALIPILSRQPGFVSYNALDAGNDVAISVSVYADRAAADAANAAAAEWVRQNIAALVGTPEVTFGEVVASSLSKV